MSFASETKKELTNLEVKDCLRQGGAVRADSDERFTVIFKPPSRA